MRPRPRHEERRYELFDLELERTQAVQRPQCRTLDLVDPDGATPGPSTDFARGLL
jgi:hypothetical protein